MATVNGNVKSSSGGPRAAKVEFVPTDTPFGDGTDWITSPPPTVYSAETTGNFSIVLKQGNYKYRVYFPDEKRYDEKLIVVPDDNNIYLVNSLVTGSSPSLIGSFNQNVSFERNDSVMSGEYVGGRYRWASIAHLKSATVVCASGPVGAAMVLTLEINGVLTAYTITVSAGQTGGEVSLPNVIVPTGQYVRWKCTSSPADIVNAAAQVVLSLNLNT